MDVEDLGSDFNKPPMYKIKESVNQLDMSLKEISRFSLSDSSIIEHYEDTNYSGLGLVYTS
jgi:hypothetical protein